jgi:hypothetical protein
VAASSGRAEPAKQSTKKLSQGDVKRINLAKRWLLSAAETAVQYEGVSIGNPQNGWLCWLVYNRKKR